MAEYPYSSTPPAEAFSPSDRDLCEPSLDQPLDAIVYERHPAFVGQQAPFPRLVSLIGIQAEPAKYKVPQRFGMSAILGIMTALAVLFGSFRLLNAEPVVYLFFGVQSLVICLAQMFNAKMPRAASVVAGAVMVPLFALRLLQAADIPVPYSTSQRLALAVAIAPFSVPVGALLGYLTGACAAGIFLIMDYLEPYLHGYALVPRSASRTVT